MNRKHSHFENREPILEKYLSNVRFNKIIKHIPEKSKVLDLGCGHSGKLLKKLKVKIEHGFGIDLSVNPNSNENNITLIEHDLSRLLPFENDSFDIVTSLANLEHLENPGESLREIYRVLKPDGILLLTTPTTYSKPVLEFLSFRLHLISEREIRDHKHYTNKKILSRYCKQVGFSSWKHEYFELFMNNFLFAKK